MKYSHLVFLLLSICFSCTKLDVEVPIQVINSDGSSESRYFEDRLETKLRKRNFLIVSYDVPLKIWIENFEVNTYFRTETVHDDCSGGYGSFNLREEELEGEVTLREDGRLLDSWHVQASNYEVLKSEDPLLLQILLSDDDDDDCSDYWVKSRDRMNANLRACARRIAASATKKVNRLN